MHPHVADRCVCVAVLARIHCVRHAMTDSAIPATCGAMAMQKASWEKTGHIRVLQADRISSGGIGQPAHGLARALSSHTGGSRMPVLNTNNWVQVSSGVSDSLHITASNFSFREGAIASSVHF